MVTQFGVTNARIGSRIGLIIVAGLDAVFIGRIISAHELKGLSLRTTLSSLSSSIRIGRGMSCVHNDSRSFLFVLVYCRNSEQNSGFNSIVILAFQALDMI